MRIASHIDFPKVKTFLESVARGSKNSKASYEIGLKHFQCFLDSSNNNNNANNGSNDSFHYDIETILLALQSNKLNVYQTVNFARQYGMDFKNVLNRLIVTRTFTIHQLKSIILSGELTKAISKHQAGVVVIPGLLDLFDDPNIKQKEAKRIIERVIKSLDAISSKLLVIVSIQENNKYTKLVSASRATTTIKQIIRLTNAMYGRLNTELYDNQNNRKKSISLTEKDLKMIVQRK